MVKRCWICYFLLAGAFCFPVTVSADIKGRLVVEITDTKGDPIEGVTITLSSKEVAGIEYTITTSGKGKATLNGVDPVMYRVKAEKEGYQYLEGDIKLRAGIRVRHKWEMLTIEEARQQAHDEAWDKLSEEEKNRILAQEAHNAGVTAYQAGDIELARQKFTEAIGLDSNVSPLDYLLLGQFAFSDHDTAKTKEYLLKARELDTAQDFKADTNRILGACYMIEKDYEKARTAWSELVETQPDPMIYYNLANIEIHYDHFDGAIAWLEKCRKAFPGSQDALNLLGDIYIQKKDYVKGLEIYTEFLTELKKDEAADAEKLKMAEDTVKLLTEMVGKK
ncbi:carboxypeptidase regulatory-like domain-containing protein [bacterium]|nr:carboxypeptidase regulatory-like domain-containing protein [candidate division CSSED10-310 bacterium]